MKKNKIIYIHQRPYPYIDGTFYPTDSDFYFFFGQGALYALNKPNNLEIDFDIELWRGEVGLNDVKIKEVYGIKCKIFPSFYFYRFGIISFKLIRELKKEIKNNNVIIHYTASPHNYEFYLITHLFGDKTPIFVTHQGGANPYWKFKNLKQPYSYISYLIEKKISKKVTYYFSGSIVEVKYFIKIVKDKTKIQVFPHWGVDLKNFIPYDKNKMRDELGLDRSKKYLIVAGRLNNYRGIREAVEVRDKLRQWFDVDLISIGATEKDYDYGFAKEHNVILIPHVHYEKVPKYMSASDCYIYLTKGKLNIDFAGTGIAPLEAMACNVPVVANTLHHYPDLKLNEYGFYVKNVDEAVKAIKKIFNREVTLKNSREIIEKFFDWKKITEKVFDLYIKQLRTKIND